MNNTLALLRGTLVICACLVNLLFPKRAIALTYGFYAWLRLDWLLTPPPTDFKVRAFGAAGLIFVSVWAWVWISN